MFGVDDNPKEARVFGVQLSDLLAHYGIAPERVFAGKGRGLWEARLYPVWGSPAEATGFVRFFARFVRKEAEAAEIENWLSLARNSLTFETANTARILQWGDSIRVQTFVADLQAGVPVAQAAVGFNGPRLLERLAEVAETLAGEIRGRVYGALAGLIEAGQTVRGKTKAEYEALATAAP
jgi:hypothetical protein